MKPVHQTIFGNKKGNCLAAAIASVLEREVDEVPHFLGDDWHQKWNDYLRGLGLFMWRVDVPCDVVPPGYSILTGLSPRAADVGEDWLHCTVAFDGETVHDPHPDGRGVLSKVDYLMFQVLDPKGSAQ